MSRDILTDDVIRSDTLWRQQREAVQREQEDLLQGVASLIPGFIQVLLHGKHQQRPRPRARLVDVAAARTAIATYRAWIAS